MLNYLPRQRDLPDGKGRGEGAGYAGGIISAAMDGERVAEAVRRYVK